MKKLFGNVVLVVFIMIAVTTTICMLSTNKYNVIQFGNKILLKAGDTSEKYNKNSLLIIEEDKRNVKTMDEVFYYYESANGSRVKYGQITAINNDSYTIDGEEIQKDLIIASQSNAKAISLLGGIMSALTSRYGYLILIILPILIAFIYQIVLIIKELNKDNSKKSKKKK